MAIIPEEYLSSDFGFTAIDEVEYAAKQTVEPISTIDENDMMRVVLNALVPLEEKLDRLLMQKQAAESEEIDTAIAVGTATKLSEIEKLIMPLLVNLLKTADKEYIYWPDRSAKVQGVIDQLLALTRG